jgi:hypothetical protein
VGSENEKPSGCVGGFVLFAVLAKIIAVMQPPITSPEQPEQGKSMMMVVVQV